jgi:hypothetical protein
MCLIIGQNRLEELWQSSQIEDIGRAFWMPSGTSPCGVRQLAAAFSAFASLPALLWINLGFVRFTDQYISLLRQAIWNMEVYQLVHTFIVES